MSKIKTKRLDPRTPDGTLTIGNDKGPSTTQFEGTVIIPEYASKKYVESIVEGGIEVDLKSYQKTEEKDRPHGYAGLDDTARVPAARMDNDLITLGITLLNAQIQDNIAKIEQLESATAFQIEYIVYALDGSDPNPGTMTINAPLWGDATEIKMHTEDARGHRHDLTNLIEGDVIWFSGTAEEDPDIGMYDVVSVGHEGDITTLMVDSTTSKGGPEAGERIEAEIFPAVDISMKADISYVDAKTDQKVNKAGDTMKGTLRINTTNSEEKILRIASSGTDKVIFHKDGTIEASSNVASSPSNRLTNKSYVDSAIGEHGGQPLLWKYRSDKTAENLSNGEFNISGHSHGSDAEWHIYFAQKDERGNKWFPIDSNNQYQHATGDQLVSIRDYNELIVHGKMNKWYFNEGANKYAKVRLSYYRQNYGLSLNKWYLINIPGYMPAFSYSYSSYNNGMH